MDIEKKILKNLITDQQFKAKVLPFLKEDYFSSTNLSERVVFQLIWKYENQYNKLPTFDILRIELDQLTGYNDKVIDQTHIYINDLASDKSKEEFDWLVTKSEEFCQERAIYNAITESIEIIKDEKKNNKGKIPEILTDALAVSFDTHIGHDWLDQFEERYKTYHIKEDKIPFDLEKFNDITRGGVSKKTLNVIMAGTGVGKSMFMCHLASHYITVGKNVLYITLEMSEEKIAERIDANMLNMDIDDVLKLPEDIYTNRLNKIKSKNVGRLIIKEYPTTSANVLNFKALLNDLWLKKDFKPDIIFVDYLNICSSSRAGHGGNVNSYTYVKMVAEELRGMAQEMNVPLWTATQVNRSGFDNSDPDLTNTAESFGLPATADFMFVAITNDELEELGQVLFKQLKNRYGEISPKNKRFVLGVKKARMKFFDLEPGAQAMVQKMTEGKKQSKQASFAPKANNVVKETKTVDKEKFKGIKV